ncbi:conserved hypothetical protein [Leishmania infantum JPCM5]|uniref:Uncharacterized protein n=2 Tax=Leishmania infantum TaxID=5671 RepID=A4HXD3_LEIIN|nr:conserved hypothetical protein [Leishmania infantum JPCM5]CAC9477903.1 hypothetical_protein_-_conserved [Leishmania infantum]CAM59752.1 conserved hypothetical protein [Leishmania infantum JPCM5]SUZ40827.1 hypothetical_protein_-_conserved [Leishmania infantum]|eukprot:XP_001464724.1 conserved hypothetical protein [Leishmania infantum JPCM5]
MRDSDRSAAFPSSHSASARPATMEVVVQTPFIAVEGLGADAAAAASDYAQKRPVRPQHHADGPDSACLTYTDSCLTARLAEVIAEELLQGHALQRHGGVGSHRIRSASATTAAATGENREVLTFTMGPQGAANSSFLFGGTLGWPSRQRAAPTTVSQSSQALSGLFAAVLNRLFAPANAPADTRVVAAMSVTEVRDAAPLRHPSVLQRPRSTVDLLSGTVLRTEIDEVEGLDDSVDHPSDIPAACYVRVESIHDAMAVLYAALSCSAGWRHTHLLTGEAGHPEANALSSSPTAFAFLQPACEPLEERMCHVCVTLIVSCEPLRPLQHQEVQQQPPWTTQRAMDNFSDEAGHKRGSSGPAALLSAAPEVPAPVGIWKLWDVAGPSVSCGYRPLKTSSPKSAEGQGGRSAVGRTTTAPAAERRAAPAQLPTPRLPWSSRYSLAALTHTCLAEVGATLSTFALPLSRGPVDSLIPVLRHDTSTSLQIASSAVSSCSLVVPICAVVAEATVDDVNSEVLAAAAGWAALGREHQQEGQQHHQGLPRVRGLDNEDAARRVLHEYAVLLRDFVAERYGAADEGGTASPPFATARSPSASLMASQLPASNDEEGCSARQEAARVLRAPPMQASLPTSVAADSSRVAAASECGAALCVGAAPMRRMSMNTVAVGTHAAVTAPLSINVTGDAEDSPGFSLRPRVEADVRSTKLVDVLQRVHHQAHADTRAVGAVRSTDEAALSTAPPATAPASVADTCATAATHAEEARLQRFHALFESESFDVGEKAEATAAMEAVRQDEEPSLFDTRGVMAHKGHHKQQTPLPQHTPQVGNSGSPPSVLRTGRRPGAGAHRREPSSLEGQRAPLPSAPSHIGVESAVHDSMADVDTTAASLCPPQALLYDTTIASQGEGSCAAEVVASAACDAAPHACEGPTHTPAPSLPPPDGALAAFLGPYCDEFVRLCGQMRTDVQAWRAHEAATLDQLSALAERHTRDIQEVATLQRHLAANFGTVDAMPGSSGASTLAGARDRRADVGALLRSALTGGNPDLAASHSATFASTSTLIFEQLVRSEEKVTWLERQLVDWRRRAREASILDTRSTNADAAPLIASEGDGESALELSSSPPAVASRVSATVGSVLSGPREDPAAPHMREAEALLRRLLQRCTRAYAAAQQQGDRWHAQLAQEQAAKSVLQDRVMELEAELAGLRRQRSGAAASPYLHGLPAPARDRAWNGAHASAASRPPTDSPPSCFAAPPSPVAALGSHSLYCTLDGVDAERSLLTAAPVSPIASDVASSLPSSSASRGLQRRCDDVAEPTTLWDRMNAQRLATRGRNSAGDRAGTDSFGAVSTQLAVLLSRAVQGGDACAPSARTHPHVGTAAASSTSVAAPASLFEIHVGASSTVSSRGPDSPFRRDASRHSASASFSLAGNAPEVAARAGDRASDVESRERRQRRPPPSRSQHERHVEAATTPPSTTHRSARGIDEGTCGGEVLHHHVGTGTMKIGGGALVCAASHPPPSQCHATSAGELEVYPSAALEALERAATQLEAEAVRLCGAAHNTSSTAPCSQCHVAAIERRQLNGGDEVAVRRDEDIRAVHSSSPSSLCQSMGQLRSATQAVQREARDAAERERAYLSAILFSSTAAGSE